MTVQATNPTTGGGTFQGVPAGPLADAVGSQFMQLLLAQLRNQNPLDPVNDKEFMTQLTQVNSMQELQKINATLSSLVKADGLSEAAGLIGRHVRAGAGESGQARSGLVTAVTLVGDRVMLSVGGEQVALSDVIAVGGAGA